jgi:hypothetical protein
MAKRRGPKYRPLRLTADKADWRGDMRTKMDNLSSASKIRMKPLVNYARKSKTVTKPIK